MMYKKYKAVLMIMITFSGVIMILIITILYSLVFAVNDSEYKIYGVIHNSFSLGDKSTMEKRSLPELKEELNSWSQLHHAYAYIFPTSGIEIGLMGIDELPSGEVFIYDPRGELSAFIENDILFPDNYPYHIQNYCSKPYVYATNDIERRLVICSFESLDSLSGGWYICGDLSENGEEELLQLLQAGGYSVNAVQVRSDVSFCEIKEMILQSGLLRGYLLIFIGIVLGTIFIPGLMNNLEAKNCWICHLYGCSIERWIWEKAIIYVCSFFLGDILGIGMLIRGLGFDMIQNNWEGLGLVLAVEGIMLLLLLLSDRLTYRGGKL